MRFALAVSAVFALAAVVAGGISYNMQSRDLTARLQDDVARLAQSLARTTDPQDLGEQISALIATAPDGALIVAWRGPQGQSLGNVAVPTQFMGPRHLDASSDVRLLQPPSPQPPDGYFAFATSVAGGWLMVGRDDAWLTENREILLQTTAWGLGVALVLSVALALAVGRRNEARIARMQGVLEAVGAGDHARRIGERGRDDLARVAREVDATLDRLEAGIGAIRQVSTDVAHDLRAPLSRLRIRLEPLVADPGTTPAVGAEIAQALEEIDGISATFDAILRLARLQSGTVPPPSERLDLCRIVREVAELFEGVDDDAGYRVSAVTPDGPVRVRGDRELLMQALVNLVENALHHAPPGPVDLWVAAAGGLATVAVCDRGPGIALQDRPRAILRFVRLDPSRSRQGTGLGLAMVAAIAKLHDGGFDLEDNAPGLCAVLSLPLAQV